MQSSRNIYITADGDYVYQDVAAHSPADMMLDVSTEMARSILVSEPMRITHFGEQLAAMSAASLS